MIGAGFLEALRGASGYRAGAADSEAQERTHWLDEDPCLYNDVLAAFECLLTAGIGCRTRRGCGLAAAAKAKPLVSR